MNEGVVIYDKSNYKTMMKLSESIEVELTQRMIDRGHVLTEVIAVKLAEEIEALKKRIAILEGEQC